MSEIQPGDLIELLNVMANQFEQSRIPDKDFADTYGWGQFLDVAKQNDQVGPYGTCAGTIVLSLAERTESTTLEKATRLLEYYWEKKDQDETYSKRFSQILRVASLYYSLRLSPFKGANKTIQQVDNFLMESISDGCWGNYWCDIEFHDEIPRIFCSSIVILSYFILNCETDKIDHFDDACDFIESKLSLKNSLRKIEESSGLAAVLSINSNYDNDKVLSRAKRLALRSNIDLSLRAPYFFDFEIKDNQGKLNFYRDYYFLPIAVVQAIAGFQDSAPIELRIYAKRVLESVIINLKANDGLFRPSPSGTSRTNTFDQAWVATLLKIASIKINSTPSNDLLSYKLRREREDRWWSDYIKIFCIIFAIIVNATNGIDNMKWVTALLLAFSAYFGCIESVKKIYYRITGTVR